MTIILELEKQQKAEKREKKIKLLQKKYQMNIKWYEFPAGEK